MRRIASRSMHRRRLIRPDNHGLAQTSGLLLPVVDDLSGFQFGEALLFLLHGMNSQGHFNPLTFGSSTQDAPDGPSRESAASDEHRYIVMVKNQAEREVVRVYFGNPQLGLFRVINKLKGDVLKKTADLGGCLMHRFR